jgi:hypothetical protein
MNIEKEFRQVSLTAFVLPHTTSITTNKLAESTKTAAK